MKKYALAILITLFVACACWAARSYGNLGNYQPSNPIGPSNVPPSATGRSLYRSPNPIDRSGNLLMTGNVRYGRYFRPGVPYSSPTNLNANLGSTELDSFIRDSAGMNDLRSYGGGTAPQDYYFSGSKTVPTTVPGRTGVFRPSDARIEGRTSDVYGVDSISGIKRPAGGQSRTSLLAALGLDTEYATPGPADMVYNPRTVPSAQEPVVEQREYQSWREKVTDQFQPVLPDQQDLDAILQETESDQQWDIARDMRRKVEESAESEWEPGSNVMLHEQAQQRASEQSESSIGRADARMEGVKRMKPLDSDELLRQIREDLAVVEEKIEQRAREDVDNKETDAYGAGKPQLLDLATPSLDATEQSAGAYSRKRMDRMADISGEVADIEELEMEEAQTLRQRRQSMVEQVEAMPQSERAAEARDIMGAHTDMKSYRDAKFEELFRTGAAYMRQGRYYRAASAFELASVYMPDSPAANVGRALALFGAGEYMSSSLFLSRALKSRPAYARTKIDLAVALGGRDAVDKRVADMEQWLKQSKKGELEYLLAYVHYQLGRLDEARIAARTAAAEMEDKKAVVPLQAAIEQAATEQQDR